MEDRTLGHGADAEATAGSVDDAPAPAGGSCPGELEQLAPAALDAALEAMGVPAFLVRAPATVLRANARGHALLAADPASMEAALRDGSTGPRTPRRFPVREAGHFLAVFPDRQRDAVARAPALANRWRLTPRQTAVLALVAEGSTNRAVAHRLGCSEKTVELHVSALLAKTRCATRSQLVAAFWTHPHPE
jgi:DNA-binding CsgD family transcriptional regulator